MSRKRAKGIPAGTGSPARQLPSDASATTTRRRLLSWIWGGLLAVFAAESAWVAASFLRPRRLRAKGAPALIIAGPVQRFAPKTVTAFPEGRFYLARLESGGFLALDRTCTHLGCTVPWDAEAACFTCPCHASSFDITGEVLTPPAPRLLDLYAVRIENGIVKIDTARRIPREAYGEAQEAHA